MLSATHLTAGYGKAPATVRDVSLEVAEGECVLIVGPSGSGKSTLLRVLAGLLEPRAGAVRRAPGSLGYIPQRLGLVRHATARANVLLGAVARLTGWRRLFGSFPAAERDAADQALAAVGLAGRGDVPVEALSGGERRRVVLARALLQRPRVLLADEFLAEVDHVTAEDLVRLLDRLRRDTGMTLLVVDHDVTQTAPLADRVAVMVGGRVVDVVPPGVVTPENLRTLFQRETAA